MAGIRSPTPKTNATCTVCGAPYLARTRLSKYCGAECASKGERKVRIRKR